MSYILERLQEASTWRGIILVVTSLGIAIEPALAERIIAGGVGLAGLVGMFTKDKHE